jgi:hypothetical protein
MDWEQQFQRWDAALGDDEFGNVALLEALEAEARSILERPPVPDLGWLLSCLEGLTEEDRRRRHFIRIALRGSDQMPEVLLRPMLRAAVYERDPSFNKLFILPCLRHSGPRRVNEELLRYLESGTNAENAGAASAFYWSLMPHEGVTDENIDDLVAWKRHLFLTEFVSNEDVEVRRRILPGLRLEPEFSPEEMRPLMQQAIKMSREHTDEYIRRRIEIQLGSGGPLKPVPS